MNISRVEYEYKRSKRDYYTVGFFACGEGIHYRCAACGAGGPGISLMRHHAMCSVARDDRALWAELGLFPEQENLSK